MEKDNSKKSKQTKKRSPKVSQKKKKAKEDKRTKILKAAQKVFSEHPYHTASMRMIAKEAGIDHPLIIYYFPSKGALFEAILVGLNQELSQELPKWFKGIGNMSLSKGVSTYLDRAIGFYRVNPGIMRIILLNMTQSIRKSGAIPGYQHIQKAFEMGAKVFKQSSRFKIKTRQMSFFTKGVNMMMTNLMGAREYHAEIQGLDPKSDAFFKWAKDVIMFMILPVLNSFELKE
jgi:AcrR family transcriptional regulator